MDDIIYYVSNNLNNISVAKKLANSFIENASNILDFPFGQPIYKTVKKLENEYRSVKIKNFLIITIVRVLYKKMDISNILK